MKLFIALIASSLLLVGCECENEPAAEEAAVTPMTETADEDGDVVEDSDVVTDTVVEDSEDVVEDQEAEEEGGEIEEEEADEDTDEEGS